MVIFRHPPPRKQEQPVLPLPLVRQPVPVKKPAEPKPEHDPNVDFKIDLYV